MKGVLVVEFDWPLEDQMIPLRATYPDSFPRNRPIVFLRGHPTSFPKRHVSPLDGNICLLGRDSAQWPNKWTLADLLRNQLKNAIEDTGAQDAQGEPTEFWWNLLALKSSFCLVDSTWQHDGSTGGDLTLRFEYDPMSHEPFAMRALVGEIRNANGSVLQIGRAHV